MIVVADAGGGHVARFVVGDLPSPEDLRRVAALASMPGLAGATWWGEPEPAPTNPHPAPAVG